MVPQGEYHGGLSTAMGGGVISVPFEALTTRSPKTMRPPYSPCKRRCQWRFVINGTWRIRCSGTGDTVKQASYVIERVPTIKFSGRVYNDQNGNGAPDEQEN